MWSSSKDWQEALLEKIPYLNKIKFKIKTNQQTHNKKKEFLG
jgi:hypothetical protein